MFTAFEDFMPLWEEFKHLIIPLTIILTAFVTGLTFNRITYGYLGNITYNSAYRELLIKSLKGIPVFWSLMAGIYLAVNMSAVEPKLLALLQKAMLVLVILSATVVCARVASGIVHINAQKAEGIFESTSLLVNIVEFAVYAVGFLIILQSLGISVTPILTAMGVGGLAVALALQDTLANLIAGIHIIIAKRIKPGDYVKLSSGEEGHVTDINWRDTTLKGSSDHLVIVPNSKISAAIVTNYALPDREVSVSVPVGVGYDSDLSHVEKVAVEVATNIMRETPGGVRGFTPVVRFTSFDDSNISFNVVMRGEDFTSAGLIRHEFIKKLFARFTAEGIDISYPVRVVKSGEGGAEAAKGKAWAEC